MSGDNLEGLKKQLSDLEKENKDLHEYINKLEEQNKKLQDRDNEIASYRLFIEAKEHFLRWLNVATLGIAGIGVLAIVGLVWNLSSNLEAKLREIDTAKIEENLQNLSTKSLNSEIFKYSQAALRGIIEAEVKFQVAKSLGNPEPMFLVVVSSSNNPSDLDSEYRRARRISGDAFGVTKFDIRICDPIQSDGSYALVIGSKMTLPEAVQVMRQAIADNFRAASTFPVADSVAFFDFGKCEVIQAAET